MEKKKFYPSQKLKTRDISKMGNLEPLAPVPVPKDGQGSRPATPLAHSSTAERWSAHRAGRNPVGHRNPGGPHGQGRKLLTFTPHAPQMAQDPKGGFPAGEQARRGASADPIATPATQGLQHCTCLGPALLP